MWTVIYIAPSVKEAERIQNELVKEGFLIKTRPLSGSKLQYEILVPKSELQDVKEILNEVIYP